MKQETKERLRQLISKREHLEQEIEKLEKEADLLIERSKKRLRYGGLNPPKGEYGKPWPCWVARNTGPGLIPLRWRCGAPYKGKRMELMEPELMTRMQKLEQEDMQELLDIERERLIINFELGVRRYWLQRLNRLMKEIEELQALEDLCHTQKEIAPQG